MEIIDEEKIKVILDFLSIEGTNQEKIQKLEEMNIKSEVFQKGLDEIKQVMKYIKIFGVPEENYTLDLSISRGLDYYTGTVYETFFNKYRNIGSVCSGGRYDNLTEFYSNRKMPGVGISIGLSRLFFQLIDNNIIFLDKQSATDVLVVSMKDEYEMCANVAKKLREKDIKTSINIESQKIGKKFKYANNLNVKYVVIIGEEEAKNNLATVKNMQTGEQNTFQIGDEFFNFIIKGLLM